MALVFPWVLYIGVPVIIVVGLFPFKKKDTYRNGKRVANTGLIEETDYYKKIGRAHV